jgi:small subunit ribosomal protein S19e
LGVLISISTPCFFLYFFNILIIK